MCALAADVLANASLGVWLGTMVFFSFVVAPRVFAELERDRAGDVVNRIFPTYYVLGGVLGVVALASGVARGVLGGFGVYLGVYIVCVAVGVCVAVFSRLYLVPRIRGNDASREDGDEDAFERYHGLSVRLNSVTLAAVGAAIVLWHV